MSHKKIALVFAAMGTFFDPFRYLNTTSLALRHHFFIHKNPPFSFFQITDAFICTPFKFADILPAIADVYGHNSKN